MKTKCLSVRLERFVQISDKAYKAVAFDGSSDIIPASQYFGRDYDVQKSDAYWISEWILQKKDLQYSAKKEAWFDSGSGDMLPTFHIEHHKPNKITKKVKPIKELKK